MQFVKRRFFIDILLQKHPLGCITASFRNLTTQTSNKEQNSEKFENIDSSTTTTHFGFQTVKENEKEAKGISCVLF